MKLMKIPKIHPAISYHDEIPEINVNILLNMMIFY